MAYNLIEERWIPIRRQSGKVESIAPWQIAEKDDPPIRIESSRPDFDAGLLEMLIGLVQTVMTPSDEIEWREIYRAGIEADRLREKMMGVKEAFYLDGDGPRFFQDLDVHEHAKAERKPIGSLLIDRGNASDAALFAKSGGFEQLGLPMVAAALLTMQQFSPSGGAGIRTSLRGGGPLSITIKDVTLWRTCWCNVLSQDDMRTVPGDSKKKNVFPWMVTTRTSEKGADETLPTHVHPLEHFWSLPRRYRLCLAKQRTGICAISGEEGVVVTEVWSRPHGVNYSGPFRHPLTAYTESKPNEPPIPRKGRRSGLSYRDWPLLHLGGKGQIPPAVVEAFYTRERSKVAKVFSVVARGYAMDNMKPLQFVETETPILRSVSQKELPRLRKYAEQLVKASDRVREELSRQAKAAWTDRPKDLSGDVQARTDAAFLSASEPDFYAALRTVVESLDNDCEIEKAKTSYIEVLRTRAQGVFDALCPIAADLGAEDLGRIVRARKALYIFTSPTVLATVVGLAEPDGGVSMKSKARKTTKRKEGST